MSLIYAPLYKENRPDSEGESDDQIRDMNLIYQIDGVNLTAFGNTNSHQIGMLNLNI